MVYLSVISANQVEAFRYRIRDDDTVVLHEKLKARFTVLPKGSDLFKGVTCSVDCSLPAFITSAQEKAESQINFRESVNYRRLYFNLGNTLDLI